MTAKPKSAIAKAIARHAAAQAAYDARPDDEDETCEPLCAEAADALSELAETPCANDAEFVEKTRYMLAAEDIILLQRVAAALCRGLRFDPARRGDAL